MYEIYINDRPLRLVPEPFPNNETTTDASHLVAAWRGKTKTLLNYADTLEKGSPKIKAITLYHKDLDLLWSEFQSHYKIVEAAGGLVQLAGTERFLIMERRGYIDLPKGKIDPGESAEDAARREVSEETGLALDSLRILDAWPGSVSPSRIGKPYRQTLHTYRTKKGKRILKPTHWYPMVSVQSELIPQIEEGIEWVAWQEHHQIDMDRVYPSLRQLLLQQ
ncbi:MAG: NUDIX domain-containing protein [Bacteroidota bacterium]